MPTEHILLESDVRELPEPGRGRKLHAAFQCASRLRRRRLALVIVDYYYLGVRSGRASRARDYVLDLRFIEPPLIRRHVPWRWIAGSAGLAVLTALCAWHIAQSAGHWWRQGWLLVCAALFAATVCACLVSVWRTTETLTLESVHGRATLLEYTAGLGTLRAARQFMRKLAAHIQLAIAARRASKVEHLRDEMREHFRLKEAGVLSPQQYEAAKARILAQHGASAGDGWGVSE